MSLLRRLRSSADSPRDADQRPLVLVVGLQKSGTSLAMRLLEGTGTFSNPLSFEAKELWGDVPPFAPREFPAGFLYQRANGERGHELEAVDATPDVVSSVRERLDTAAADMPAVVLKSPYGTVRLPWIREIFPRAHVVAVVRRPIPNVFSLLKKHGPNPHTRRGPEEGWWGVKPAGWRELVSDDKVAQAAHQWERVNAKLWSDRELVDRIVPYQEICADPGSFVEEVAVATGQPVRPAELAPLDPQDDEALRGGPLESANKVFKRTGGFQLEGTERGAERLEGLSREDRSKVERICAPLAERMGLELGVGPLSQSG